MAFDKERFKVIWAEEIEAVARENAKRKGSNVLNEPHGLVRAIASVLANNELRSESLNRAKCRYEDKLKG